MCMSAGAAYLLLPGDSFIVISDAMTSDYESWQLSELECGCEAVLMHCVYSSSLPDERSTLQWGLANIGRRLCVCVCVCVWCERIRPSSVRLALLVFVNWISAHTLRFPGAVFLRLSLQMLLKMC